jgi:hypothetical protein
MTVYWYDMRGEKFEGFTVNAETKGSDSIWGNSVYDVTAEPA